MKTLKIEPIKENGILQIGLCISGLTIAAATEMLGRINNLNFNKAIVYLGSFDIVNDRELIELMNDFENFIRMCKSKKITAVVCTLAPLPFHEEGNRKATLDGFNKFLKNQCEVSVIDINKLFSSVGKDGHNQNYYMSHRGVSGSRKRVSLWSLYGIQEFRKTIMKKVGFALVAEKPAVF